MSKMYSTNIIVIRLFVNVVCACALGAYVYVNVCVCKSYFVEIICVECIAIQCYFSNFTYNKNINVNLLHSATLLRDSTFLLCLVWHVILRFFWDN